MNPVNPVNPTLDLSKYSGIKFPDGTTQPTSASNVQIQSLPGQLTLTQLPNPLDVGTF